MLVSPFVERLYGHMRRRPESEAICADGCSVSYGTLVERVERAAAALQRLGIGPCAVVGIMINDEVEHLIASLALLRAGAWQIALASHDGEVERASVSARAGVTHIVRDGAVSGVAVVPVIAWPLPNLTGSVVGTEGGVLLRTSGTTGEANIVPLAGAELVAQAGRHPEYNGGRLLFPAHVEHNNAKRHRLYCAFMGGTNVFRPVRAYDVVDYCRRQGVTALDLALMQATDIAGTASGRIDEVLVRVSGSPVPLTTRRMIEERLSKQLCVRYGATEAGTISACGPGMHDQIEGVGKIIPGLEVQIVDEAGIPQPAGVPGYIRVRGPGIATAYVGAPEQTAKRFREGWFWPGDHGAWAENGELLVLGRDDDMINLNGINIFPAEIERVLEQHHAVEVAAALPIASAVHGQIPVAAVELRTGGVVTDRDLVAYARERLALRAPRRIILMDRLPRNSQGKILKREIAKKFELRRDDKQ